jgi:MYXO-CTERM domain-containing protein
VDVAASDPHRLYISAFRQIILPDGGSTRTASLFVSKDDGTTWTEYPVPLDAFESAVYIAAVDASNADKVYVRSEGQSRLMLTTDGGKTFTVSKSLVGNMLGFALSPDGSKVWFGSAEDGLLELTDTATLAWTQKSTIRVLCLAARGADLWACSDEPSGFIAGVSSDDGTTFSPKLHLDTIRGPLACPQGANDAGCDFAMLCANLGGCTGSDGGPAGGDGGGGDGGVTPPTTQKSCGCSVVGGGGGGALLALGAIGAATAVARRRRARRRDARLRKGLERRR